MGIVIKHIYVAYRFTRENARYYEKVVWKKAVRHGPVSRSTNICKQLRNNVHSVI